jgi:pimeloyl-ACP methyl ester carboxylesterase
MGPDVRYTKSGDVSIAYQVTGQGRFDLVLVPGWVSHLEYAWEEPTFARFLARLASFSRLILLDRRGTGLSDRVAAIPTLEERMDDVRAVMDAAGSARAALFGVSEGGPMCALFAAAQPERTAALVLYGTFARGLKTLEYPWGRDPEVIQKTLVRIERQWGTAAIAALFAPSIAKDERLRQSWARFERLAVSPGGARMLMRIGMDTDVRDVLPAVRVPTLVLARSGDRVTTADEGRFIAERIPGARLVELPGADHMPWIGEADRVLDEVEEFLTGVRRGPDTDRLLATVLFTDIVGSTERAAALGDRAWRDLLERHHAEVRQELARFRGREVSTAGDGFFAVFDGPARAIRCAAAVQEATARLGLSVRAGLHTGECELAGESVAGIAVHIGARVAERAAAGEVLVSGTVKDLVAGSNIRFADRGTHVLRGVPGEWRLFAALPGS